MPRIKPLLTSKAPAESQPLLEGVQKSFGITPNLMATLAHSPAALQSYLGFGQALSKASLSPAIREQLALAIAGENSCGYCASAHTLLGKNAGVDAPELTRNLAGNSSDPSVQAAIDFALAIVTKRGWVDDDDLASIRAAGYSEGEVVEIIAVVAQNIFSNYFNHISGAEIDFPEVKVPEPLTT